MSEASEAKLAEITREIFEVGGTPDVVPIHPAHMSQDEFVAWLEWKAAANDLMVVQQALQKANERFRAALQRMADVAAPPKP